MRCFEAAARLLSLKLAASELCVTPSAVSQQIARLEETLNVPLFIRTPRRLQLTAVGEIYLRAVQPAVHQIAAATQRLQVPPGPEKGVSYTHIRAHENREDIVWRLLLSKKKNEIAIALR
ncbi:LysR family transcriptional regulator [Stenotrophomonas maltophilia]|uniref:LysR family transcriptional regulator n=1 Tax=Stenotrophomonas maltophilia TaxID=40324 RepID=UPI003D092E6E